MKIPLFAAVFILSTVTTPLRATLIQLQAHGSVTTSTNLPALVGQQWTLKIIYDTSAPILGDHYINDSVLALRVLDLTVGGYAIHLLDPISASNPFNVRIDVSQFNLTYKNFIAHVEDPTLLPSWGGQQINNFMLFLEDNNGAGYADGTYTLPADPMLTLANFTSSTLNLDLGGGNFNGALTDLSFTIVSELPVVSLPPPPIPPKVAITGKKNFTTSKAKLSIKGKASQATLVTVKVGKASARPAIGTSSWRFTAKLKPGTNKVRITASGPGGVSIAKMTILRE